ncbi:AbrB family transcriptional regulator [Terasakiella sp. A23]|uniref:AbrB family transcriptional regulator n=1 Tax=Terasakiella sp. FCG-A23 TaxID=3080561 RepID=UPI0029536274|nr:AbrB family transcriptional regulator [Terasakiella sp. A23]MDV7340219.1 AbrB family transcriptional regulator [Terasakiella sp. A23]
MINVTRFIFALVIGGFGGCVFNLLHFPLPWLLGALAGTIIASLSGAQIEVSKNIRRYIAIIIGLMLGSTFTPDILVRIHEWVPTLTAAVVYVFIITAVAQIYCRKVLKMDGVTALFSGLPGGLSEMTLLGEEAGADIKKLTLTHACRVACVLMIIPFALTYLFDMKEVQQTDAAENWNLIEIALLIASGAIGAYIAKILNVPANKIIGPLVISSIIHLIGWITSEPHAWLSIAIQLLVGSSLGTRFYGTSVKEVGKVMVLAIMMTLVMLSVTFLSAYLISLMTGISFSALLLALSPGGFAEMALAALSMGIDPAFVTTHHAARLFVIVFITPIVIKLLLKKTKSK